ncbi:MAG: hypothetical protein DRJ63_03550 [Thermoprotei archaeon]|nr:MAG: hypothetical protein DRJ63_03550 [Thermoprotei archaeon]
MEARLAVLLAEIDHQWNYILKIYDSIEEKLKRLKRDKDNEDLRDSLAYRLHNLYCAYEDLFKIIAKFFENRIEDPSRYHIELLRRMLIEIKGIRPNLISEKTYVYLNELRGFRHVFRHAYAVGLDVDRIISLAEKALILKQLFEEDLKSFKRKLYEMFRV